MSVKSTFRGGDGSGHTVVADNGDAIHPTGHVLPKWHRLSRGTLADASMGQRIKVTGEPAASDDYRCR